MAVATFDTLKFANTLKTAGVPPQQAEAQAVAFAEVVQANFKELATKDDLDRVAKASKDDLDRAVSELKAEMRAGEQRLDAKIDKLAAQNDGQMALLKWMFGAMLGANLAVLTVVLRAMYLRQL